MASPEQTDTLEQKNSTGVGALLKASRLRTGEDLRDIVGVLKIRHVYLEAIEDGRFEDLPGTTYTLGFVRAYAEHLGLDSGEVIRRFKSQELGMDSHSQLDFPEPIPEASVPGGAVIFIGVVVAVLAYGAWYVNSSEDGFFKDLIAPLPERFAKMSEDPKMGEKAEPEKAEPEKPEPETTATEQVAVQPAPEETQADANSVESTQENPPAVSEPETVQQPIPEETPKPAAESVTEPKPEKIAETTPEITPETTPDTTTETAPETTPETTPETMPITTTKTTPESIPATPPESAVAQVPEKTLEAVATEVSAPAPTSPPAPEPRAATETPIAPDPVPVIEPVRAPSVVPMDLIPSAVPPVTEAATVVPTPASEPAPGPVSATSGAAKTQTASAPETFTPTATAEDASRIIVRAKTNSWIQVRDDTANELLLTRLLRAGDSYTVPGRSGLMLSTGNAGALEILVDGTAVPPIGAEGVVRRKVLLDADRLKAGTAVNE